MKDYLEVILKHPEFFGVNRHCNICGYSFSKFGNYGKAQREARCPVCGSLDRHRHLYVYVLPILPFLKGKYILHFAPEPTIKEILNKEGVEYKDCDLDPKLASIPMDITDIKFKDNTFDYIFCIHVLEHIGQDEKAMSELCRVLKPGGTAFLSVPLYTNFEEDLSITDPQERLKRYGKTDHVRNYNFYEFNERLKRSGFNTEKVSFPERLNAIDPKAKYADTIFLATK